MEADAGIDAGYKEFVGPELCDECNAMSIACAGGTSAIPLREAVRNGRLPAAKIDLLLRLSWLLDGGLQFSIKVPLSDFVAHGTEQSEVARMSFRNLARGDVAV